MSRLNRRVAVIAADRVAPRMAGAGIRASELARELGSDYEVVLVGPEGSSSPREDQPVQIYDPRRPATLKDACRSADVLFSSPLEPRLARAANGPRRRWIVDLYNPEPFEGLEHQRSFGRLERRARGTLRIDRVSYALRTGDAFICASERQRDMWLGFLAASRRLDSAEYEHDPELRNLIDIAPSGLPAEPVGTGDGEVRGSLFPLDARIVVWHGGLWDWLDPEVVLRAVAQLYSQDRRWRLAFTGTGRPSNRAEMSGTESVARIVRELELAEAVHLPDAWTPYEERASLLCEADVGVSAHFPTLEARFAFRTRMLDYIWAHCPIVCSAGDVWAERVAREDLGEIVDRRDPRLWAQALARVAQRGRESYAPGLSRVADQFRWRETSRPLSRLIAMDQPVRKQGSPVAWSLAMRHSLARRVTSVRFPRS